MARCRHRPGGKCGANSGSSNEQNSSHRAGRFMESPWATDAVDAMDVAAVGAMDMALRCMKIWVLMVMSLNMHTTRSGAWVYFWTKWVRKLGEIRSSWLMKRHSCVHVGYKLAPEWQENMAMANMNYGMPQGDVQPPSADPQVQWWVQKSRGLQGLLQASHWMSPFFFGIFFPPENKIKKTNAMKVFSNQNILGYQWLIKIAVDRSMIHKFPPAFWDNHWSQGYSTICINRSLHQSIYEATKQSILWSTSIQIHPIQTKNS